MAGRKPRISPDNTENDDDYDYDVDDDDDDDYDDDEMMMMMMMMMMTIMHYKYNIYNTTTCTLYRSLFVINCDIRDTSAFIAPDTQCAI